MSQQRAAAMIDAILRAERLRRDYRILITREALRDVWCARWMDPAGRPGGFTARDLAELVDRLEDLTTNP